MDVENNCWELGNEVVRCPIAGITLDNEKLKEYISHHFSEEKSKRIALLINQMTPLLEEINKEIKTRQLELSYYIF